MISPVLLRGILRPTPTKGLFRWRAEVPRRRNNFSFCLHAEISVGVVTKWRRKTKQNCRPLAAERPAAAMFVCLFVCLFVGFFVLLFVPGSNIFRA